MSRSMGEELSATEEMEQGRMEQEMDVPSCWDCCGGDQVTAAWDDVTVGHTNPCMQKVLSLSKPRGTQFSTLMQGLDSRTRAEICAGTCYPGKWTCCPGNLGILLYSVA